MREELISFIWKSGLFRRNDLRSVQGAKVQILHLGDLNRFDGPDFENACIKVHGLQWSGAIELHTLSSDWYSHGHDKDPRYDQVVLHVCWVYDKEVRTSSGRIPEHLQLSNFIDEGIIRSLESLMLAKEKMLCHGRIKDVPPVLLSRFCDGLSKESLQDKRESFQSLLLEQAYDRPKAVAIRLAEVLGKPGNEELMSHFIQSLDHRVIARKRDQLTSLIAYILGKAGRIPERADDPYIELLQKEYRMMIRMDPRDGLSWNWRKKGIRSGGIAIRLVVLCLFMEQIPLWMTLDIHHHWKRDLRELENRIPNYWQAHFDFGKKYISTKKYYTQFIRSNIFINVVVPYYLSILNDAEFEREWPVFQSALIKWRREENRIVKLFRSEGLEINNADRSQAVLYLFKSYCQHKKCVNCEIGDYIIQGGRK